MGVNQQQIADKLNLARSTVTKILNQFPNNRASMDTVRQVFQAAREMGYDFGRLRTIHRRRADRKEVNLQANLRICLSDDDSTWDSGTALVRNLSPYGAYVVKLETARKSLPLLPFHLEFGFGPPLDGVLVEAKIIRFSGGHSVELGVDFIRMSSETENRIIDFLA